MANFETDPEKLPWLGRKLLWVDKPGSANKIFWALIVVCALLIAADLLPKSIYYKKTHFDVESVFGAYAIYGYVMFTALIFAATALRWVIKRDEDYYGTTDTNAETYPEDQLQKETHDGL